MFDKMKQLMEMQKKMQEMKRQLDSTAFEAASSDGLVVVTMNGSQEIQAVSLKEEATQAQKSLLEKSIKDAYNRAIKRSHEIARQKMQEVSGLDLPGLL